MDRKYFIYGKKKIPIRKHNRHWDIKSTDPPPPKISQPTNSLICFMGIIIIYSCMQYRLLDMAIFLNFPIATA